MYAFSVCFNINSVYPCVYREHIFLLFQFQLSIGLSLCIQGTLSKFQIILFLFRFIPVYTGNILRKQPLAHPLSVYPCVYREHVNPTSTTFLKNGLSLCIQGTYPTYYWQMVGHRFIPVYTGNIIFSWLNYSVVPVYPCVYREHSRLFD